MAKCTRVFSRVSCLLLATTLAASAQVHFHFGADAGVPLTDTLNSYSSASTSGVLSTSERYNSVTKRFLAGPVLRLDFASGFGLEFDALYQRVDYDYAMSTVESGYSNQTFEAATGNRWQFPLLIQYTRKRMFVEGGLSISHIGGGQTKFTGVTLSGSTPSSSSQTYASPSLTQAGVVVGAGVDLPFLHGHLRPELRYTRWLAQNASPAGLVSVLGGLITTVTGSVTAASPASGFNTNPNEVAFLLGWTH